MTRANRPTVKLCCVLPTTKESTMLARDYLYQRGILDAYTMPVYKVLDIITTLKGE